MSIYLGNGLTDRHKIWLVTHVDRPNPMAVKFRTFERPKRQMATVLKRRKYRNILATVGPIGTKFYMLTHTDTKNAKISNI